MAQDNGWQDIASAPRDGSPVWVRRMSPSGGGVVKEGWAVFGVCHAAAPQRQSLGLDPLGRLSAADYAREAKDAAEYADTPKWLLPDRMYSFPTPTEWLPPPPQECTPD